MYESKRQPLLQPGDFLRRLLGHLAAAMVLLGGMGPVHVPVTGAGKLFAGIFALYAGLVFIATAALLLGPVVHRVLHRFHLDRD